MYFILDFLVIEFLVLPILLAIARFLFVMHKITTGHTRIAEMKRNSSVKTLICVGSGGHTTEMLQLIKGIDLARYSPRYYVMAETDTTSFSKVAKFEGDNDKGNYESFKIPRSREVRQSYITSIFSTTYSILCSIPLVLRLRPDLILCNGPGTCIPICVLAFILKVCFICDTRIVFFESFCRTETFSLTGRILMYFADNIIVHWQSLKQKLKRSDYIGQLL